tara:strand:- start:7029 stop:8129 length:1101 start_codon:yes stop_codon:yes gene_type:complete
MDFDTPTLSELRADTRDDFNSAIEGADSRLAQGILRVIGDVIANLVFGLYAYLRWQYRQMFTDTADEDALVRDGEMRAVFRGVPSFAVGTVAVTGTNGATIEANAELATAGGTIVIVTEEATIEGGEAALAVVAAVAGAAGNLAAATSLSFTAAISGVNAAAAVAAPGMAGGADKEDLEAYRARVIERKQRPPQGGSANDYRVWAGEVPGVTRAWPSPKEQGIGTVTVRFMMDDVRADFGGIPQGDDASDYDEGTGDQALVFAYMAARRPEGMDLYVCAPLAVALDLTITNLTPDTVAVKAAIEAELRDMLRRDAEPGGTIHPSRIGEAVSIAVGEGHHVLTAPVAPVTHAAGEIAVLGTVTYETS